MTDAVTCEIESNNLENQNNHDEKKEYKTKDYVRRAINKYKKKKKLIYKIYINNNLNSIINKCNKIKKFNIKTYKNKYYKIIFKRENENRK